MRSMSPLLACALLAAACGGPDEVVPDDDPAADASPDDPDAPPGPPPDRAVFVAGDFNATGIVSTVDAPSLAVDDGVVAGVAGADPFVRRLGDELVIVNRFGAGGDNVTVIDAASLQLVAQYATGAGSNPQDVAAVGDKLYVATLGAGEVVVIDRGRSPAAITSIDLSTLDDDGIPDCVSAIAVGTRVFVACALLDSFAADQVGKVVVIDTTTDTVATTIDLPEENPVGWFVATPADSAFGGDLLIATVPSYDDYATGCLARVTTGATPTASCGPTNQSLAGYVNRAVVTGDALWTIVFAYDAEFNGAGAVVAFDLETGAPGAALTPPSILAQDLAVCGDHVFVADKTTGAQGARVYAIDGDSLDERTEQPLDIGLPPAFGNAIACADVP